MNNNLREICLRALQTAINTVQPFQCVYDTLFLKNNSFTVGNVTYNVNKNVHLAAFGKAALGMVQGAEAALNNNIIEGIASVPRGTIQKIKDNNLRTKFFEGATNNLPDDDACKNTQMIEDMARRLNSPDDIFLVLISGGGSALLSAPILSITLSDKRKTIKAMTSRGAEIKQLNIVRKAISRLKGGKLARIAHPAKTVSVIISDIVGDPLESIASGPTVVSHSIEADPIGILKQLDAWNSIPISVQKSLLETGQKINYTEKLNVQNLIVSNNKLALLGAKDSLVKDGFKCHIASNTVNEDANEYGEQLANLIECLLIGKSPKNSIQEACIPTANDDVPCGDKIAILLGGECTVQTKGTGKGGRNQQIVLAALSKLLLTEINEQNSSFALLSGGTDGQDGPTDAAGAVLTNLDLQYIKESRVWKKSNIDNYLNNNDSYNFWQQFNDGKSHIICGPSGTNVMDIQVLLFSKH